MSLSRPELRNPATRFMQWGGGAEAFKNDEGETYYEGGKVSYWDKEANDGEGANIEVELPLTFIVLDELSTITGFNKATNSGFWSNEVKDLNKAELVVRNKQGVVARGRYKDIADEIKAKGAKYTKSIYIAFYNDEKELVLGHLKLSGAAMSEWIEFTNKIDISKAAVTLAVNPKVKTNGTIKYFVPAFSSMKISAATLQLATKVDEQLQEYLDVYFTRKPEEEAVITEADDEDNSDIHNIAGVDSPAEAAPEAAQAAKPAETLDDGTSTEDAAPAAPAKPTNKPASAAKAKVNKADESIKLNDVEF